MTSNPDCPTPEGVSYYTPAAVVASPAPAVLEQPEFEVEGSLFDPLANHSMAAVPSSSVLHSSPLPWSHLLRETGRDEANLQRTMPNPSPDRIAVGSPPQAEMAPGSLPDLLHVSPGNPEFRLQASQTGQEAMFLADLDLDSNIWPNENRCKFGSFSCLLSYWLTTLAGLLTL